MNVFFIIIFSLGVLVDDYMKPKNYSSEIYLTAIGEYLKVNADTSNYLFIYSNPEIDSLLNKRRINEKEIICITRDEEVFAYVDQVALILEIEPFIVSGEKITVKINHNLLVKLEYPFDPENVKGRLAPSEKDNLAQSLTRAKEHGLIAENRIFCSLHQNAWTYIEFRRNDAKKDFTFVTIKTVRK